MEPALPSASDFQVTPPQPAVGIELSASYTYFGGVEGESTLEWRCGESVVGTGLNIVPTTAMAGKELR